MTVALSVSELLAQLRTTMLAEPDGTAPREAPTSHRLLGRLFHATAADATGPDTELNVFCLMQDLDTTREETLEAVQEHLYDRILGPRLAQHHNVLHPLSSQVVSLWQATRGLGNWLVTLAWRAVITQQAADRAEAWDRLRKTLKAEVPVEATLTHPDWVEPVRLTGIADLLLRFPGSRRWCAVELKTGSVPEELSVLQACLYQIAIEAEGPSGGAVSVLHFDGHTADGPTFRSSDTAKVRDRLHRLIGACAGILRDDPTRKTLAETPPPTPPQVIRATEDDFADRLTTAYADLGLGVTVADDVQVGPTFKRYRLELARGTKWGQVRDSIPNIEIRLGATTPMTLQRSVGRIYLDVQREDRQPVYFRNVLMPPVNKEKAELLVGVDIGGRPVMLDLADAVSPHVLVAGSTGSGKSEWLMLALTSLARERTPDELRFVLIDPKRTAFGTLAKSTFLWDQAGLVLPPDDDPAEALTLMAEEMERRYTLLQQHGAKDIGELRELTRAAPPRIVCVCDEFLDLLLGTDRRKEVEMLVARIGAKARAAGIHLILATQQPRRDVLSGLIQSNLPARVALKAASPIESRLMQCPGAENLLGNGDLLFRSLGEPQRLQAPLVAPETRNQVLGVSDA